MNNKPNNINKLSNVLRSPLKLVGLVAIILIFTGIATAEWIYTEPPLFDCVANGTCYFGNMKMDGTTLIAQFFQGDGSNLTAVPAAQLTGTAPLSAIPATLTGKDADTVDGYHLNQGVRTTDSPTFVTVNTNVSGDTATIKNLNSSTGNINISGTNITITGEGDLIRFLPIANDSYPKIVWDAYNPYTGDTRKAAFITTHYNHSDGSEHRHWAVETTKADGNTWTSRFALQYGEDKVDAYFIAIDDLKMLGNKIWLEDSGGNSHSLITPLHESNTTKLRFDAILQNQSDNARFEFFRSTNTTGIRDIRVWKGNGSATQTVLITADSGNIETVGNMSLSSVPSCISMKSPDGTAYKFTIANGGTTNVTVGTC